MQIAYLFGSISFFISIVIYILFIQQEPEHELVPVQWREEEYEKIQFGMEQILDNMWEITGGRPDVVVPIENAKRTKKKMTA